MNITAMLTHIKTKTDRIWIEACAVTAAAAGVLRFFQLELKPLHHDEGVNGFFLERLFNDGVYRYDPSNYHGPDLYYVALVFSKVFGLNTFSVRMSVAVFGVLTVLLVFFLRDYLGKAGSIAAGLLLALSPGMVYISRYFIHEMIFIFLSLALVVSVVLFIDREKAGLFAVLWTALLLIVAFIPTTVRLASLFDGGAFWAAAAFLILVDLVLVAILIKSVLEWDGGRPMYLFLASASLVMLFATKETAFITVGTQIIAWGCVAAWMRMGPEVFGKRSEEPASAGLTFAGFRKALGTGGSRNWALFMSAAVFVYLGTLFFSSFFTHPQGIVDAFRAYFFWTKTGTADHTQSGLFAYVRWAFKIETAILLLSAVGVATALVRGSNRFAVFSAFWAFGMLAAYSIIPYKTPWLAISFVLPMCIVAGYLIGLLVESKGLRSKAFGALLGAGAAASLAYQAYDLNFVRYDDDKMPYVYAHTRREFLDMVREIRSVAERSGEGQKARVEIVSSDYWPLPWYMRGVVAATFHGTFVEARNAEMIVAKARDKEDELLRRYGSTYRVQGRYPLRPGVELYLLVRNDLASPGAAPLPMRSAR
jgi:uncharacterized protein (TIGR03663 family)